MFNKDSKNTGKKEENPSNSINLIGAGTQITGELKTENDVRIDGMVEGNVSTNAKIVLGEQAKIIGDVYCGSGDLSGKIDGDIYSKGLLHLKSSSKVNGDIFTKRLVVEKDALFNGKCEMKEQVNFDQSASKQSSSVDSKASAEQPEGVGNEKGKEKSGQAGKKPSSP